MQARVPRAWGQETGRPDAVNPPVADGPVPPGLEASLQHAAESVGGLAASVLPLLRAETEGGLPRPLATTLLRRAVGQSALSPEVEAVAVGWAMAAAEPAPGAGGGAFHGPAARAALLSHWSEVRRWNLPAADAEAFVALANEHLRLLDPSDYAANAMIRDNLRQRVDQALRLALRDLDREQLRLLPVLLESLGLGGGLHDGRLALALMPEVLAAANIGVVLEQMVDAGECIRYLRADGRPVYLDPELVGELAQTRQRELALEQRLGRAQGPPAAAPPPPVEPAIEADVAEYKRRLLTLAALAAQGLISDEELAARRGEILREI